MLLFFEIMVVLFVGVLFGVYGYLWTMYTLNLKALEWSVVLGDLYVGGYIDADQLRYETLNPPWYVVFVRKFDVSARIAKWADDTVHSAKERKND